MATTGEQSNFESMFQQILMKISNSNEEISNKIDLINNQLVSKITETNNRIIESNNEIYSKINTQQREFDEKFNKITELGQNLVTKVEEQRVEISEEMNKQFNNFKQHIFKEIDQVENKIDEKLIIVREENVKIFSEINEKIHSLENNLEHVRTDYSTQFESKVQEMKKKIDELSNKGSVLNANTFMYKVGEPTMKFFGNDKIHPMVFINNLKQELKEIGGNDNFGLLARKYFAGDALAWFDMVIDQSESFENFENKFISYYWGESKQARVRENLIFGKYNANFGLSRERYVMTKLNKTKCMEPPILEKDFVKYLARHFSEEIRETIAIQNITKIESLLAYMRRLDEHQPNKLENKNFNNMQSKNFNNEYKNKQYNNNNFQKFRRVEGRTEQHQVVKSSDFKRNPTYERNKYHYKNNSPDRTTKRNENYQESRTFNSRQYENNNVENRQAHFNDIAIVHQDNTDELSKQNF